MGTQMTFSWKKRYLTFVLHWDDEKRREVGGKRVQSTMGSRTLSDNVLSQEPVELDMESSNSPQYEEFLFDRSRGSDDDEEEFEEKIIHQDPGKSGHLTDSDLDAFEENIMHQDPEKCHCGHLTDSDLDSQAEAERLLDLKNSSGSEVEFVKSVTNTCTKEESSMACAEDDSHTSTSNDEEEDAENLGNPFKAMPLTYFGNEKSTPYLYKGKYSLTFQDKIHILLLDVDSSKVCTKRPNGVQENCFFVIDCTQLGNPSDWLMTDIGAFDDRGSSGRIFSTNGSKILESTMFRGRKSNLPRLKEGQYLIRNVFFRHRKYQDFLRTVTTLVDCQGDELQMGLIEYRYKGEEHHVSPHKNPRTGKTFIQTAPSTREELKEKVKGHQGPSSIFDELTEKTGGIFGCEVMADMPRDVKQVKNARQKLSENENKNEFARLLALSRDMPSVRNLQWTPNPRVVICTDEQLREIVKECCSGKSQNILAIDTTYNVGDFYVTSTSYQSSKFIHSRTGKPAILPGPAMIHIRRSEKDFKYFIYTLLEQNEQLERIANIGGDRDKAQQGFLMPLKRCIFLPCTKHVEDDISRKLVELGMKDEKEEILADIFGCEKTHEKGLIDSASEDEFLAKVLSVTEKWDTLERRKTPSKTPEFSAYFRKHIEDDMRDGMLLNVRRSAGLGDEFFYNNGQECSNFKYKSKIREKKMQHSTGYRPNMKCTLEEAIVIYKEMTDEVNREKQRAVIGKGPYQLAGAFKHLEVSQLKWSSMTPSERMDHVGKVDPSWKKDGAIPLATDAKPQDAVNATLGSFDDTKLPAFLRGSWNNAYKIVEMEGIGPFPNDKSKMTVISLTSETSHTVQMLANGKFACDKNCPRFKDFSICAHTIAVASQTGKLANFIVSYEPPLERMVSSSIPSGSGKKDNEKSRKRFRKEKPARNVEDYGERVASDSLERNDEVATPYELCFVKDTSATTCYGCKGRVRDKPSSPPPPPPYDLFIRHRERRVYRRAGDTKIRITTKPEMVYFHPSKACCPLSKSDIKEGRLVADSDTTKHLNDSHKRVLFNEFGFSLD